MTSKNKRFEFGANWTRFLKVLGDERIIQAEKSLIEMLGVNNLRDKRFLDAGSGSGLFSLAACRLGATVHSFDYDSKSVACTREIKRRYLPNDSNWIIEEGSVLNQNYLANLGQFDIVYSWGVLHHTGAMWNALSNITSMVAKRGSLFIAVYNDQGWVSRYWSVIKGLYVRLPLLRLPLLLVHSPYLIGLRWLVRAVTGRHKLDRGMALWYDAVDWIGGYPFEVARPEDIIRFLRDRNFTLRELRTCAGRHGCNEYVFTRDSDSCAA